MVGGNKNMSKENTAVTKKKIKRCKEDVVFDAACFIILTLVLFVVAYHFIHQCAKRRIEW